MSNSNNLQLSSSELTSLDSLIRSASPELLRELAETVGLTTQNSSRYEQSLHEFVKGAWHVIEPGIEYRDNWHIGLFCAHLEAVTSGKIRKLLLNLPPGCMKSILVQVMWPAWVWLRWPTAGWIFGTYSQELSNLMAMKCRDLVTSPWYQGYWGNKVKLRGDSTGKREFRNKSGGWRLATSPGGQGTGRHPDFAVFDDPHNVQQAESDLQRQTAIDWWRGTMSTRGQARGVRQVGIMQRLNEDDLSAYCIKEGGWEHIVLPMEYEPNRMQTTSLGLNDPRTEEGELLWPEIFPAEKVQEVKNKLGPYGVAGQFQQRPSPAAGGMFDPKLFRYFSMGERVRVGDGYDDVLVLHTGGEHGDRYVLEKDCFWFQTVDTALKTADANAYTVIGTFLLTPPPVCMIVYDMYRHRIPITDQYSQIIAQRIRHPRVHCQYIEEAASGIQLLMEGRNRGTPFRALRAVADKVQRATAVATMYSNNMVYHRAGAPWLADFEGELLPFPNANNKDQVDVLAYAGIIAQGANADRRIVGRSLVLWPSPDFSATDVSKPNPPVASESKFNFPQDERKRVLDELLALGSRSHRSLN